MGYVRLVHDPGTGCRSSRAACRTLGGASTTPSGSRSSHGKAFFQALLLRQISGRRSLG
jgi:hypothetical protein